MAPPLVVQVTPVLVVLLTVALNCWLLPAASETDAGETVTAIGAVTVTVAEADLLLSATLVAVTV